MTARFFKPGSKSVRTLNRRLLSAYADDLRRAAQGMGEAALAMQQGDDELARALAFGARDLMRMVAASYEMKVNRRKIP